MHRIAARASFSCQSARGSRGNCKQANPKDDACEKERGAQGCSCDLAHYALLPTHAVRRSSAAFRCDLLKNSSVPSDMTTEVARIRATGPC